MTADRPTGDDATADRSIDGRPTRRRVLGAVGAGLAATVAGCGYRPGGGELDWRASLAGSDLVGFGGASDEIWRSDGDALYRIRNRSGRRVSPDRVGGPGEEAEPDGFFEDVDDARVSAYGETGRTIWGVTTDAQYVGEPAIHGGRIYLQLEDGTVTALQDTADDEGDREDGGEGETRWTSPQVPPALDGSAADGGDPDEGNGGDGDEGADGDGTADDGPADGETDGGADDGPTIVDASFTLELSAGPELVVGVHRDGLVGFDADDGDVRFDLDRSSFDGANLAAAVAAGDGAWAIGGDDGSTLFRVGATGDVDAVVSLPASADWLDAADGAALVGVDDELWAVDPDGDRRFAIDLLGSTGDDIATVSWLESVAVVPDRGRCYHYADGRLEAIDVATGERVWDRDDHRFRGLVADADGLYGLGRIPGVEGCGLAAVSADGDPWWAARLPDGPGCTDACLLVGDRLVVVADDELYGFRRTPGNRLSVL